MRGPTHQLRDDGADNALGWSALHEGLQTDPGERLCHHSQLVLFDGQSGALAEVLEDTAPMLCQSHKVC